MKIALLSDIHGILPALETVLEHIDQWQPDCTIVNGDVVNRGPKPAECWGLISERLDDGWQMTLGNHEQYTLAWNEKQRSLSDADRDIFRSSYWTHQQLTTEQLARMVQAKMSISLDVSGTQVRATHGSIRSTTEGTMPGMSDDLLRERMHPAPDVFVSSHTHRMFVRHVDKTLVVNTGSVGVPLDGDARAGYVQLVWDGSWQATMVRLDYDRAAARRDFLETDFVNVCGASAPLMFLEWEQATSHMGDFGRTYTPLIDSAKITPQQAVRDYLQTVNATEIFNLLQPLKPA